MQDEQTKSDEDSDIVVQGKDYKVCGRSLSSFHLQDSGSDSYIQLH